MATKKKTTKKRWFVAAAIIIIIGSAAAGWYYRQNSAAPIPADIRHSVSYGLYYPSSLPAGFIYDKNSARIANGVVFYSFSAAGQKVVVSEQALPNNPPDLKNLPGFNDSLSTAGTIATGSASGIPTALLETPTSLVTVAGQRNTSASTVSSFAQQMKSL